MLGGSYEEARIIPTALNLGLDFEVQSFAGASSTAVAVAEAARQHFGGVLDEPRWGVDVGELTRVADVTLAEATEMYETAASHDHRYLHVRGSTDSATESRFLTYSLSSTELHVDLGFCAGESRFQARNMIAASAEFIIALDGEYDITSVWGGDGWTGAYHWMLPRGTAPKFGFVPYAWMFVLPTSLIDPTACFGGTNYAWHELSRAGLLCWWTGGSNTDFWTGGARSDQRRLLGDLFPTCDPSWRQMVDYPFEQHVLAEDLEET